MKKLQQLINRATRTQNAAFEAAAALNAYCESEYGLTPSDVDADEIIDAVFGGCGLSNGMSAADFDRVMRERSAR